MWLGFKFVFGAFLACLGIGLCVFLALVAIRIVSAWQILRHFEKKIEERKKRLEGK